MVVHMIETHDVALVTFVLQQYDEPVQSTNEIYHIFRTIRLSFIPTSALSAHHTRMNEAGRARSMCNYVKLILRLEM